MIKQVLLAGALMAGANGTNDLKVGRDGWTKNSLRAWPDYKYECRKPARSRA